MWHAAEVGDIGRQVTYANKWTTDAHSMGEGHQ